MSLIEVLYASVETESVWKFQPSLSSVGDYVFPREQTCAHITPEDLDDLKVVLFLDSVLWS